MEEKIIGSLEMTRACQDFLHVVKVEKALGLATGLFIHTLAASFGLSIVYIRLHLDDNRPFCGSFDRNNGKYNIPMADKKTSNA